MRSSRRHRAETPIERALRAIAESQARYDRVEDYTCTFYKRERIAGRMTPLHIMSMKVRTKPQSIYFKFQQPAHGREAIYIAGRHGSKVLAHDVGLNKILAGTLALEPTSSRAMEDCRHPITEAGIGPLLETLAKRWAVELDPEETKARLPRRYARRPAPLHHDRIDPSPSAARVLAPHGASVHRSGAGLADSLRGF